MSMSKFRSTLTMAIEKDSGEKEITSSWALFISIMLLIIAFFTSYTLQQKKVQAVHETVISIFAGWLRSPIGVEAKEV
jgi:sodium/hydrogen exchanger-like protein 6/7